MSCRVLKRRVEEAVLDDIVASAQKEGASALLGKFIQTAKNDLVKEHYAKLGFTRCPERDDEGEAWLLELADYEPKNLPMKIVKS